MFGAIDTWLSFGSFPSASLTTAVILIMRCGSFADPLEASGALLRICNGFFADSPN